MKLDFFLIITSIIANVIICYYVVRACKEFIISKKMEGLKFFYDYIESLSRYREVLKARGYIADAERIDKKIVELLNKFDK